MKVLLVADSYPPEVRSASTLTQQLAERLVALGHETTVLTTQPRYNLAEGQSAEPLPSVRDEKGVRVVRTRTLPAKMVKPAVRGVAEATMPLIFVQKALRHLRGPYDVIQVYSPSLMLGVAGWMLKKSLGGKLVLNVQDLFPQTAVDLGMLKPGPALTALLELERRVYAFSDSIVVHSPGNRDFLVKERGLDPAKIEVVHNWIDLAPYDVPPTIGFRDRYRLKGKFVLLFAGVHGPAQGLETVVDAAWALKDHDSIRVLLVGDGSEKAALVERCRARGQTNVQFEEFVPQEHYPDLVRDVDAGLVSLTAQYSTPVVPGKILGYMAGAIPVVAALNPQSDGHSILAESGAGLSVMAGDVAGLAAAMLDLSRQSPAERQARGASGRRWIETHVSVDACLAQLLEIYRSTPGRS